MRFSNVDNWGLAATSLLSIAFVLVLQHGRALDISSPAEAAAPAIEPPAPTFVMTITAKRLPSACKGVVATSNHVYCSNLLEAAPVVVMTETGTQITELDSSLTADSVFPEMHQVAAQR